ncbi:Toll-like receptor 13 Precursor [Channa argus]|uniref:Toll-like receptor 13 n=1 Tax=Channa argus TaxID=215402 RepID=A0A6G1QXC7_CHAAH|nr:Toll-like receptor 13 Precursor [Channa argus]
MASLSLQTLFVILQSLLLHPNPLLAYSLKDCTINYVDNPLADVFVDCSTCYLVTVPDDIPRDVTSVKFNSNQIKEIKKEDFGKLSKLRFLDLEFNSISHVDDESFIHLAALTTLNMYRNELTNLTANLFQGLSMLTELDLGFNYIHFIHTSAFQFLTSLQTLFLENNRLQQITDIQPILQLPHLQVLSISYNQFSTFETKDLLFNVSSGLKILNVSQNEIKTFSITPLVFPHLEMVNLSACGQAGGLKWDIPDKTLPTNLTELIISNTLITFEEIRKVLQNLDSLIYLGLNHMEDVINKGLLATVCKIPTLRKLDLSYNSVNSFSELENCSQLSDLDLSITHTSELPKDLLRSLKRLRSLKLNINLLRKVPEDIRSLSTLEILNLSDNLISDLGCEDFINTTSLTELYLNTNRIIKLNSCVFENFTDLKVLDISDNLLQTIGDAFKLGPKMLMFLNLSDNVVLLFEQGDFQGLKSLKHLDVSNNIVRLTRKVFNGLINLESLSISVLSLLYYNIKQLQQLKSLNIYFSVDINFRHFNPYYFDASYVLRSLKVFTVICTGNPFDFYLPILIQTLQSMRHLEEFTAENIYVSAPGPDTFYFNNELKNLTIRKTDLSHLNPKLFQPVPNLQVLDLSNCKLKSLDFLAQPKLSALRYLKLTDNELTVINETVFQSLPALTYLDLDNNPFTCDCSNAGFIQWVKSNNQTQVVNAYQYTCFFPMAAQGRKLMDFDVQSCWTDVGLLCFISSTCLVLLTLLSSFIYHFLRWQLAYGFYLFLAFIYDSRKKKKGAPHQYDAFVSYNVHDEDWVYREMLPVLEGEQGWRLCLHHRDFQPGKPIMENITDAIYGSRKTICVISRRYLQSEWCSREIQMASFRLFDEQKDVLILLFLEDIPTQQLSPYYRMRKLVKRRTYLSWSQAGQHTGVFWQNVHRALETGDAPTDTDLLTGPAGC